MVIINIISLVLLIFIILLSTFTISQMPVLDGKRYYYFDDEIDFDEDFHHEFKGFKYCFILLKIKMFIYHIIKILFNMFIYKFI